MEYKKEDNQSKHMNNLKKGKRTAEEILPNGPGFPTEHLSKFNLKELSTRGMQDLNISINWGADLITSANP